MTLIDRYLTRQYLTNIGILFLFFFTVVIVIDFSLNFDEYTDVADRLMTQKGQAPSMVRRALLSIMLLLDLWWPRLFQLYNVLLGMVLVGAMGFTCAQMVKHRELVAMLAGGLSLHRVARPIVIVALALTAVQAANREFIIPGLAPLLTRDKGDAGARSLGMMRQPLCADSQGRLFYARSFDLDTSTIDGLWVWDRDEDGLMTRRITADQAVFEPGPGAAGGRWLLKGGRVESRQVSADASAPGATGIRDPLRQPEPITELVTDVTPTSLKLRRFENYSNNLSSRGIAELIDSYESVPQPPISRIARLERIRYGRLAALVCNILTLLLCVPFFLRREPANMIVQSLYCAPVTVIAVVGAMLGTTAAIPGLPPQLSVFIPVMILLPLAIAAVTSVKT